MQIRSITAFTNLSVPLESGALAVVGEPLKDCKQALTNAGYKVQTTRLAVQPFPEIVAEAGPASSVDLAQDLETLASVHEIDYVSLGVVKLEQAATFVDIIVEILKRTESVFASVEIANRLDGISLPRIRLAADLIQRVAGISPDGFGNLRLAALANVAPGAPFFPAAYHDGGKPRIAIAAESADLALKAAQTAHTLDDVRSLLRTSIETEAARIQSAIDRVLDSSDVTFGGIDFSLAPYPSPDRSIGAALEGIGLPALGEPGSLFASAFFTEAIQRADFPRAGFNGLMLPVLEDSVLAQRSADGVLSVSDLLSWSAVCGTGLDTIPLPGETGVETIAAILLDVAAMALRLNKPLTARLMPMPGKVAGEEIAFDFEYFANSRVMAASSMIKPSYTGLLKGDETLSMMPHSGTST